MRLRTGGVIASLVLATACGGEDSRAAPPGVETVVTEVGGVLHVDNRGSPAIWRVEEVVRIGEVEGDGPEVFGQIRSVAADAEGNVYVADAHAREIRVFDAQGRFLRAVGREGSGPGELRNLMGIAFLGDTLAALDPGNARIQLYSRDGEALGSWRATGATGPPSVFRPLRIADREFWTRDHRTLDGRAEMIYVRHTAAGPADSVAMPIAPAASPTFVRCEWEDAISFFDVRSAPQWLFDMGEAGRWRTMWTAERRITVTSGHGDTLRTISWSRPPVPLDDATWEEETADFREFRRNVGSARCQPASPMRPAHRSAARHLMSDDRGRLWVESALEDGWSWDVFDTEGRWLAQLSTPPRSSGVPPYVREGYLYQVETDELDVQSVVVYRIAEG